MGRAPAVQVIRTHILPDQIAGSWSAQHLPPYRGSVTGKSLGRTTLAVRGASGARHRDGRGAAMARRDNREYRTYLRAEQRRQRGCIARRMQRHLHHGLLGNHRPLRKAHSPPHRCGFKWEFGCGACSRRYLSFGDHGWIDARSRSKTLVVPNRWQDADCGTSTATAPTRTRSRWYRPVQNRRIKPVEALAKSRFRGLSNRSVRSKCRSPNVRK